jgi:hypothetical protein
MAVFPPVGVALLPFLDMFCGSWKGAISVLLVALS